MIDLLIYISLAVFAAFVFMGVLASMYVSARPNEVLIITGLGKQRSLIGKAGWKIPLLEKTSSINIEQFSVDVNTSEPVPTQDFINVRADAIVKVKVATNDITHTDPATGEKKVLYTKEQLLESASQNFLNRDTDWISAQVQDVLEGNLREIIGQMDLRDMVTDRQQFAQKVFDNAQPDLAKMGLEIIAFTVQNFTDDQDAITNLGIDNLSRIQKDAANARAVAEREMAEVAAEQEKIAEQAKADAALAIAQKQNSVKIEKAKLKAQADREQAQADAVLTIEQENQRKEIERQTAEANIVKQQKEAEVAAEQAKVREQELNATIRKQAEAEKYAEQQRADAELYTRQQKAEAEKAERQAQAEADLYETQKEAEALKAKAEAQLIASKNEAEGISAKGQAEAEAIKAKLNAEAEGLRQKAEAMQLMQDAAKMEMVLKALPEIAKAVATPLGNIDHMTVYGADGGSKLVGDVMQSMDQVSKGMGLNIADLLSATLTGRAMANGLKQANIVAENEPLQNTTITDK